MNKEANAPTGVVEETPEQFAARRDAAISNWLDLKGKVDALKPQEVEARSVVSDMLFNAPKKGTNRYHLNAGYAVKLVHGTNYTLGDKNLVNVETQEKIPVNAQVQAVLGEIAKLGNRGPELAEDLVKWKPELNEKAYLALDLNDESEAKAKQMIDSILTSKPATPQLTFEIPKEKR
jgi:hypothetical protein